MEDKDFESCSVNFFKFWYFFLIDLIIILKLIIIMIIIIVRFVVIFKIMLVLFGGSYGFGYFLGGGILI